MPQSGEAGIGSGWPLMLRLSKVFADPLRFKILIECRMRQMSPRVFHERLGKPKISLEQVSRDFEVLAQYGWIDPVQAEGDVADPGERRYRANETSFFDVEATGEMSGEMRSLIAWGVFETLADRVKEAVEEGTMDRVDQHVSWTPLTLDRLGWEKVISRVDALLYSLAQERREAEARIAEAGAEPVSMTVALLAFESPEVEELR